MAMFCDIDDFCKWFAPLYHRYLLEAGHRHRSRQPALALSESLTILVYLHSRHYRTYKHYDTEYIAAHLRPYFPPRVHYSCFMEFLPRAFVPRCCSLQTRKGRCTGMACIDSTPLSVCHNRRGATHKVFAGWATRGKTSRGWFYDFTLHLVVNNEGKAGIVPYPRPDRRPTAGPGANQGALRPAL
jgi:hypothetical protein